MKSQLLTIAIALLLIAGTRQGKIDVDDDFESYVAKHGKKYVNADEKAYRSRIYADSVADVQQHNSDPTNTYTKGINEFSDMTIEEFTKSKLMTGTQWNAHLSTSTSKSGKTATSTAPVTTATATTIDWSAKMTPIKNQGQCGSCWTFATVGLIQGGIKIKNGTTYDFAEQELVDCCTKALSPSVCSVGGGCNGGNSEQALTYVSKSGITTEAAYPYKAVAGSCKNSTTTSYKVVNAATPVTYVTNGSATALKTALNAKPVGIYVDATYWSPYATGIFSGCKSQITLNHAVVAVGYDASGNWKVRNSWGTSWGEAGYIQLPAAGNPCGILSWPFTTTII